ncbi:hypothetical protein COCON_G00016660 [Conger conger]|uniref:Uncharacterized protein n=1 Tax=Conger conger TaxID=82655 RepID=A0A9Q1E3L8_CONCO|nr:hypothetical protein COCON_G00016660 [Conger conger]
MKLSHGACDRQAARQPHVRETVRQKPRVKRERADRKQGARPRFSSFLGVSVRGTALGGSCLRRASASLSGIDHAPQQCGGVWRRSGAVAPAAPCHCRGPWVWALTLGCMVGSAWSSVSDSSAVAGPPGATASFPHPEHHFHGARHHSAPISIYRSPAPLRGGHALRTEGATYREDSSVSKRTHTDTCCLVVVECWGRGRQGGGR